MASLFLRFPQGKTKALTFSYDDGVRSDIRLLEIFRRHGLKGTFNVNSGMYGLEGDPQSGRLSRSEVQTLYTDMEVAVHGVTHPFLERLPAAVCTQEILGDRLALEEQLGCLVQGMAYPFGTYSPAVVDCLAQCGIRYARTVHSTHSFAMPKNWLMLDPTCHHNDPQLFELADHFLNRQVTQTSDYGAWLFYVWGHSYEFNNDNNWQRIEEFAEKVAGSPEVWYATNGEIFRYTAAFDSLEFSADCKRVYNPSAQEVWFNYNGLQFCVPAGQQLEIKPETAK